MNTNKLPSENEAQYIWRICQAKDNGVLPGDAKWQDVADIINKNLYGEDISLYKSASAYRKRYQYARDLLNNHVFDNPSENISEQIRELERLKIQYRDERNAWNKQNYADARVSQKLDYLEKRLLEENKYEFKASNIVTTKQDNDLLVILSDLHIGQTFYSAWGCYDSDIAKERIERLLNEVIAIKELHNSENVYIIISGDLISGNIHKTIQVTNRENVIDQIKIASDLISNFCYELCQHFSKVIACSVCGNHSRIAKKEDALHDERLDDLIAWIVSRLLSKCENFEFIDNNLDNGLALMTIRDKVYVGCHGDYDAFTNNGVAKLCMMLGFVPYAVTFGHLHTCAVDECNGVKMIRGGSLAGSGDSYTVEKRLSGKPSQMVCVCTDKGIRAYYTVELN